MITTLRNGVSPWDGWIALALLLLGCTDPGPGVQTCRLIDARALGEEQILVSERWTDRRRVVLWNEVTDQREVVVLERFPTGGRGGDVHLRDLVWVDRKPVLLLGCQEWTGSDGQRRPGRLGLTSLEGSVEWIDSHGELGPLGLGLEGVPRLSSAGELVYPVGAEFVVRRGDGTLERGFEGRREVALSRLTVDPTGTRILRGLEDIGYVPRLPL